MKLTSWNPLCSKLGLFNCECFLCGDTEEEEEDATEFLDGEKLKKLANAHHVLNSIGMMTEGVDRQIWHGQSVLPAFANNQEHVQTLH